MNEHKLSKPFTHDGKTITHAQFSGSVKVIDRINAQKTAKELFSEEQGDSVLICILAQVASFFDSNGDEVKINAMELAEHLEYDDYTSIYMGATANSFLDGADQTSKE